MLLGAFIEYHYELIIKEEVLEGNIFHYVLCLEQNERNRYKYDKTEK